MKLFLFLLLSSVTSSAAASAPLSVFVESLADNAYDCKPDFPNPPPMCAKSREVVRELNKQLSKTKRFTFSKTKDGADLVVEVMVVLEETGKYAVTDRSVSVGATTYLDFDVKAIKVKRLLVTVYRDGVMNESILSAKSVKDLRRRLERSYPE